MTTKRFLKLQIIFIVIFVATIICNTFAWAPRPKVTGGGFMTADSEFTGIQLITSKDADYYVNGQTCTAETYMGTLNEETGEMSYDTTAPADLSSDFYLKPGEVIYFRTIITNPSYAEGSTDVPTNVSLFIQDGYQEIPVSDEGDLVPIFKVGVSSPAISDRIPSEIPQFEWFPIVRQYNIAKNQAYIDWYVYNSYDAESDSGFEYEDDMYYFQINELVLTNH